MQEISEKTASIFNQFELVLFYKGMFLTYTKHIEMYRCLKQLSRLLLLVAVMAVPVGPSYALVGLGDNLSWNFDSYWANCKKVILLHNLSL